MDNLIGWLLNENLEQAIDKSRESLLLEDDTYIFDRQDMKLLEKRYEELNLCPHDKLVINDYVACINTMHNRIADISYIAGVSDILKLLNSLGELDEYK